MSTGRQPVPFVLIPELYPRTIDEYAESERLLGRRIFKVGALYWHQVRPFFYRPLLATTEFSPDSVSFPLAGKLGGFQHALPPGSPGNSSLKFLIFRDAAAYDLRQLDYNRKRQVTLAARKLVVAPIADLRQFQTEGYEAYLCFFNRTGYRYGTQRRRREFFECWAERLLHTPGVLLLGAFHNGHLRGVGLSQLVEGTLLYSMFFCDDVSLRLGCADLMVHSIREIAAGRGNVQEIFVGMYKGGQGVDTFFLLRGCSVVEKSARLSLSPLASFFVRRFKRPEYARMRGVFDANQKIDASCLKQPGVLAVSGEGADQ